MIKQFLAVTAIPLAATAHAEQPHPSAMNELNDRQIAADIASAIGMCQLVNAIEVPDNVSKVQHAHTRFQKV